MAEDLSKILGWGIIGTPDGMQSRRGGCIADFEIGPVADLDNRHIEVYPGTEILCQFWEIRNNLPVNYYMLYRFAREINSARPGAFYGSVLVSVRYAIEPDKIYAILSELAGNVIPYLDQHQRFKAGLAEISLPEPAGIRQLSRALHSPDKLPVPGTSACLFPLPGTGIQAALGFFTSVPLLQTSRLYNRAYGTASAEIIQFVGHRKSLKIINQISLGYEVRIDQKDQEIAGLQNGIDQLRQQFTQLQHQQNSFVAETERQRQEYEKQIIQSEKRNAELERKLAAEHERVAAAERERRVFAGHERKRGAEHKSRQGERTVIFNLHSLEPVQTLVDQRQPPKQFNTQPNVYDSASRNYKVYLIAAAALLLVSLSIGYTEFPGLFGNGQTEISPIGSKPAKPVAVLPAYALKSADFTNSTYASRPPATQPAESQRVPAQLANPAAAVEAVAKTAPPAARVPAVVPLPQAMSALSQPSIYTVQKGDNSLQLILKHLSAKHPEIMNEPGFEADFKTANRINSNSHFKIGQKLVFRLSR